MERGVSVEKEEGREDWGKGGLIYVLRPCGLGVRMRAWLVGNPQCPNHPPTEVTIRICSGNSGALGNVLCSTTSLCLYRPNTQYPPP